MKKQILFPILCLLVSFVSVNAQQNAGLKLPEGFTAQLFAENICTDILLPLYPRTATPTNFESKPQITYKRSILEIGSYESSPLLLPTMPAEN